MTNKYFISTIFYFLFLSYSEAQNYTIVLGRPTDTSITASILFDQNVNYYLKYGETQSNLSDSTVTYTNVLNVPDEIDLRHLQKNTKYYYVLNYKLATSSIFLTSPIYSFQTQRDSTTRFTFTVEADEHLYDRSMGSPNLYKVNLSNQQKDTGDFMISLGDIFGDDHTPYTTTSDQMKAKHLYYRQYLGNLCHSVPFFVCLGNHEGENDFYLNSTPPNNIATYATLWRKYYYPNPYSNTFYSGNTSAEAYGMNLPENYYSWTWGNALFVVLDIYRDQCDTSADPKKWNWTLGLPQYTWFKNVLEGSHAKYKFVFTHHPNGQQRGGANCAKLYEWGGYEKTPQGAYIYKFTQNRPGWAKPIHQLMVDNGVTILFQGHDHLFAKEDLDGIVYQEVPMAADSTYQSGVTDWGSYYSNNVLDGSGHIKVTVDTSCVKVDYVRAYLPADTIGGIHHNREVAFSYTIGSCESAIFTFTGNGNWTEAGNWENNQIPPTTLSSGEMIIVNPIDGGNCILNTMQNVSQGANIIIKPNKKLIVKGNLNIQ